MSSRSALSGEQLAPLADEVRGLFSARPDLVANPYGLYRRLRNEAPVFRDGSQVLFATYADVARMLKDTTYSSQYVSGPAMRQRLANVPAEQRPQLVAIQTVLSRFMTLRDPPDHTRLRQLAHLAFTPRQVARLRDVVDASANELLDGVRGESSFDLVAAYSHRLPLWVICDMLGIPRADSDQIHEWAGSWATLMSSDRPDMTKTYPPVVAFLDYIRALIRNPPEEARETVLGALIEAEAQGDRLTEDELVVMVLVFLFAGHETTTNLITNGLYTLLQQPADLSRLREDRELIPSTVEEVLRFESPVQEVMRVTTVAERFEDVEVMPGETIRLMIAAANRDPEQFADPDGFVIDRSDNRHLGFSLGPHFCLGASLARLEARIAFETLFDRYSDIRFADKEPRRNGNPHFRGFAQLPVSVRP